MWALRIFLIIVLGVTVTVGVYIIKVIHTLSQEPDYTGGEVSQEEEGDLTGLEQITEEEAGRLSGSVEKISRDADTVDILLLGVDSRSNNFAGRSDVMLLIRVNSRTGKIKMASFMRDLLVEIPGHGKNRINTAYMYGGPDLAMEVVNETFGLEIDKYMVFNFHGAAAIVDMMGGVTVDIQSNEIDTTNDIIRELNQLFGSDSALLRQSGAQPLDGVQATAYMRNRKTGTDTARTGRQRTVLVALLRKLGNVELTRIPGLINTGVNYLRTNIPAIDMPGYASLLLDMSDANVEQLIVPDPYKSVNYNNMAVILMKDADAQIEELHRFLLD